MVNLLQAWEGSNYKRGDGLLLLSESIYCWRDEETGLLVYPKPDHHEKVTVHYWGVENFGKKGNHYPAKLTRTLCAKPYPPEDERLRAWNNVAYASYVQRPMRDCHERPSAEDMAASEKPFMDLLDLLRPSRVLSLVLLPGTMVCRILRSSGMIACKLTDALMAVFHGVWRCRTQVPGRLETPSSGMRFPHC